MNSEVLVAVLSEFVCTFMAVVTIILFKATHMELMVFLCDFCVDLLPMKCAVHFAAILALFWTYISWIFL